MKLKIHDEYVKKEEPPVLLKLLPRTGGNGLKLCVVNEKGEAKDSGIILTISDRGQVRLLNSVDERYGLHWCVTSRKAPKGG